MSVLLFLISVIVGLVVTALINRLMALLYLFMVVVFGILLLISYKDALPPVIDAIFFMIGYLLVVCFVFVFLSLIIMFVVANFERFVNYLKNKIKKG